MVPKSMPSLREAVATTKERFDDQLDYLKTHKNEQLAIGNLIDATVRLLGQLLIINLVRFGQYGAYAQISRDLAERETIIASDIVGRYAKAAVTPDMSVLWEIFSMSEDKTKTVWRARQERTPSRGFRSQK